MVVLYYKLKLNKMMGDGKMIPHGQSLIFIKQDESDEDYIFFETDDNDEKLLFWAKKEEVEFFESKEENWSEEKIKERNKYINGEFV